MAKDVIITPASGLVDFKGNSGNVEAYIQLNDSNQLNIVGANGDVVIGDATSNVYIGDGINNVDIVFEQDGAVKALTTKTLTLGQSDSFLYFASNITSPANIVGNVIAGNIITNGLFFLC